MLLPPVAWPVVLQTWATEQGPCSLDEAPEGTFMEPGGLVMVGAALVVRHETSSGERKRVEVLGPEPLREEGELLEVAQRRSRAHLNGIQELFPGLQVNRIDDSWFTNLPRSRAHLSPAALG